MGYNSITVHYSSSWLQSRELYSLTNAFLGCKFFVVAVWLHFSLLLFSFRKRKKIGVLNLRVFLLWGKVFIRRWEFICTYFCNFWKICLCRHTHIYFKTPNFLNAFTLWVLDPDASPVTVRKDNSRVTGSGYPGRSQLYSSPTSSSPCDPGQVHCPFWFCLWCPSEWPKPVPKPRLTSYPCCRHRQIRGTCCPSHGLNGEGHPKAASATDP